MKEMKYSDVEKAWGPCVVYEPDDDPEASKAVRLLFPEQQIVLKMFDDKQKELYSLKVWEGNINDVTKYWRMNATDRYPTLTEMERVVKAYVRMQEIFKA